MGKSILKDKSYAFAIRIVRLSRYLQAAKKEQVLSKPIVRSGTAIGALVREAGFGRGTFDVINKMYLILKKPTNQPEGSPFSKVPCWNWL